MEGHQPIRDGGLTLSAICGVFVQPIVVRILMYITVSECYWCVVRFL